MENEIMNTELETEVNDFEAENDVIVVEEEEEADAGKAIAVAVALIAGAVVATAAIIRKNKGKFTEWQIKRLEKKGYMVTKCEQVEAVECECEDAVEEVEEDED